MPISVALALSQELLTAIDDQAAAAGISRSEYVEAALRSWLRRSASQEKNIQDMQDLAIINRNADRLNAEAANVLSYQWMDLSQPPHLG